MLPINIRQATKAKIQKLLEIKITSKGDSFYNLPALPIYKRNGTVRLAIDCQKINEKTTPITYNFFETMNILSDLRGSTVFSQIDLSMEYYQIKMKPESRKYTTFSIFGEHSEFIRMPFGLSNALITFQRSMNFPLGQYEYVKIFLEDILVHFKDIKSQENFSKSVFKIIISKKISINFDKSRFFKTKVSYLGNFIDKNGTRTNISRLLNFHKLIPRKRKQLPIIIGVLN